jgi:hypothetical protein
MKVKVIIVYFLIFFFVLIFYSYAENAGSSNEQAVSIQLQEFKERANLSDEQVIALKPILEEHLAKRGELIFFDDNELRQVLTSEQLDELHRKNIEVNTRTPVSDSVVREELAAGVSKMSATGALEFMATACEGYAKEHSGKYPSDSASLTKASPPYIATYQDYCGKTVRDGYIISCSFATDGYSIQATPAAAGAKSYTIKTGMVLTR